MQVKFSIFFHHGSLNVMERYKYFEIERDFFNKLGVLIDGDFKFGVLLLVFVRFLGGDTGNLYRNRVL
jgi:hypothetical protein